MPGLWAWAMMASDVIAALVACAFFAVLYVILLLMLEQLDAWLWRRDIRRRHLRGVALEQDRKREERLSTRG